MSYYEGLPIFKSAMQLNASLDSVVRGFAWFHKYQLGTELRQAALEIVKLVTKANRRTERAAALVRPCDHLEELKLLVNVGREVNAFKSFQQAMKVMEQVVALGQRISSLSSAGCLA